MTLNDTENTWIYPSHPRPAVQLSIRVCCRKVNKLVHNVVARFHETMCAAEKKMSAAEKWPKRKWVRPKRQYVAFHVQIASTICVAEKWMRVTSNRDTKLLTKFGTKSVTKSDAYMHHSFVNNLLHPSHWLCPNWLAMVPYTKLEPHKALYMN